MKNIIKIVTGITLILLLLGICSAASINDVKILDGFEKQSDNFAKNNDFEVSVSDYSSDDYDLLFTSDGGYVVTTSDNITNYTDSDMNIVGCLEVIQINGEDALIEVHYNNNDNAKLQECYDYLIEFNKLNNITPIEAK